MIQRSAVLLLRDSGLVRVFDGPYSEVLLLPSKEETSETMSEETVALVFIICHSWRAPATQACANAGGAGEHGIWIWMR